MAAPALSTPFQPYVYQSPQAVVTPFQILGGEAQVLQIMLKSQEKVTTRTGSMCYMSEGVQTETNGAAAENAGNVVWQWLFGRVDATTTYVNSGTQDGYIGLAAPSLARILPIDLAVFGGEVICQRDSFLCSINDVSVSPVATRRVRPGVFGGEGFMMQKLVGRGLAFITAGGSIVQKNLTRGEVLVVDAGCLVAATRDVELELKYAGPLKRAIFGSVITVVVGRHFMATQNESLLHAHLTGPGVVFVQSLPFFRLAQKIARAMTAPHVRDNPRFFLQIAIIFFVAYVMVVSSLLLTDQ